MKPESMTLKGKLAFVLIGVSASMVFVWMLSVFLLKATVDAGMAALLASFVTMFIKMAADASGYQYTSSAGSEKKDEVQAAVAGKLADKVAPAGPAVVVAWWSLLTPTEQAAIESAALTDPRVSVILAALKSGKAEAPDLADLVTRGLLTQARADEIKAK